MSGAAPLVIGVVLWCAWGWFLARPVAAEARTRGEDPMSWGMFVFFTGWFGLYVWERAKRRLDDDRRRP